MSALTDARAKVAQRLAGTEVPLVGRLRKPLQSLPFPYTAPTVPQAVELPEKRGVVGTDFPTDWARTEPARRTRALLIDGIVRPIMAGLAQPTRRGEDRLDGLSGPAVFAANHHSHIDTPLLLSSLPAPWRHRAVVGAAADYFFGTRVTGALSALVIGAIPIDRTKLSRTSTDLARDLIDEGWSLVVFPEGGRSPDGWGQPFRGGAAFIAQRTNTPVVPVHIEGTGRILRKGKSTPTPSRTTVTFGEPMFCGEGEDARAFNVRIEARVAELADEAMTDWWQARKRAHAADTPSLTGPQTATWRRVWELDADRQTRKGPMRRSWPR
ncbi:MAG: lysophospholipid acyltransferase family protein [Acidimicrobiia bacterium]|nr:lysophospholipid acyltransferase family protein [Acidimicrobiia bacterium]